MNINPDQFVTRRGRRVLTDSGQQGMSGQSGVGSTTEKQQGHVAAVIYENCTDLSSEQLYEIIEWVRLYIDRG